MTQADKKSRFKAKLLRPAQPGDGGSWAFVILPKSASEKLPRRGRTTVQGTLNGHAFQATLDPDGQLGHWLKVTEGLRKKANAEFGGLVTLEIAPVRNEPEPEVPTDFREALAAAPREAQAAWKETTTIARLDWIHWITSAKQSRTRSKRIQDACSMLASGKKRVCCFDQSGFYSKSLGAPRSANDQTPGVT